MNELNDFISINLKTNETHNFLEADMLQILTQEETETRNKLIIINEKELLVNSSNTPQKLQDLGTFISKLF
jgi:hypothetical protein